MDKDKGVIEKQIMLILEQDKMYIEPCVIWERIWYDCPENAITATTKYPNSFKTWFDMLFSSFDSNDIIDGKIKNKV